MKAIKSNTFEITFLFILGFMFFNLSQEWVSQWLEVDSFYSFGLFLLIFVGYLIKKDYEKLSGLITKGSWYGIPFLILGFFLYVIGIRAEYDFVANAAFPVFIAGAILVFKGKELFKALLFPLILLTFALPVLPLHRITMPFQLLSAEITTATLNFLGLNAVNMGNIISVEGHTISVVAGCSGLKSLYALFFICVIYSYFIKTSLKRKFYFVSASIPFAIFMNVLRILAVSFFVMYNGEQDAKDFHDAAGTIVYIISIIVIIVISRLIENDDT